MDKYFRGTTLRFIAEAKDVHEIGQTPDSHSITLYDADGTLIDSGSSPTQSGSTGNYYYEYTIPASGDIGNWKLVWEAVKGTSTQRQSLEFEVREI